MKLCLKRIVWVYLNINMQVRRNNLWQYVAVALFVGSLLLMYIFEIRQHSYQPISKVQDETGKGIALPLRFFSPLGESLPHHFIVNIKAPLSNEALFLYIPYFEQDLELFFNDNPLQDYIKASKRIGPLSSAFAIVPLPRQFLKAENNTVTILLGATSDKTNFIILSPLYLGNEIEIKALYRNRLFVENDLKSALSGMQLFLAFSSFILVYLRRTETVFLWLGLAMSTSSILSIANIAQTFPQFETLAPWFYFLSVSAALSFVGFILSLSKLQPSVHLIWAVFLIPIVSLTLIMTDISPPIVVMRYLILPVVFLSLLIGFILMGRLLWWNSTPHIAFLASGMALMLAMAVNNLFFRFGFIDIGYLSAQPARALALTGIAVFMMTRIVETANALDQAAKVLADRLRQREEELSVLYEHDRLLVENAASLNERNRLTAELHDGVAGYLSTIVALSDSAEPDSHSIQSVARDALAELRLVINTMAFPDNTLRMELASLYDRSVAPLTHLGIQVDWSMVKLPDVNWLSAEEKMSILRILQEAISNALRHGKPRQLLISGDSALVGLFVIRVINTGGIALGQYNEENGLGLQNMQRRAQALGGSISLQKLSDGAEFALILPIDAA